MPSPTVLSLRRLRQQGFLAAVVETFVPRINRKRDLYGIGDILAVHPRDKVFLLVQTTSAAHVADRLARVRARAETAVWLQAGGQVQVHGWRRVGKRWRVKVVDVQAGDLAAVTVTAPGRRRGKRPVQPELFD